jgi:hypothetical protein
MRSPQGGFRWPRASPCRFNGQLAAIKALDVTKQADLLPMVQAEVAIYGGSLCGIMLGPSVRVHGNAICTHPSPTALKLPDDGLVHCLRSQLESKR